MSQDNETQDKESIEIQVVALDIQKLSKLSDNIAKYVLKPTAEGACLNLSIVVGDGLLVLCEQSQALDVLEFIAKLVSEEDTDDTEVSTES